MASNFPTAYVRVASQTYVLQHIFAAKPTFHSDSPLLNNNEPVFSVPLPVRGERPGRRHRDGGRQAGRHHGAARHRQPVI